MYFAGTPLRLYREGARSILRNNWKLFIRFNSAEFSRVLLVPLKILNPIRTILKIKHEMNFILTDIQIERSIMEPPKFDAIIYSAVLSYKYYII